MEKIMEENKNLDEKKTEKDIEEKEDEKLEEYGQMTLDENEKKHNRRDRRPRKSFRKQQGHEI